MRNHVVPVGVSARSDEAFSQLQSDRRLNYEQNVNRRERINFHKNIEKRSRDGERIIEMLRCFLVPPFVDCRLYLLLRKHSCRLLNCGGRAHANEDYVRLFECQTKMFDFPTIDYAFAPRRAR